MSYNVVNLIVRRVFSWRRLVALPSIAPVGSLNVFENIIKIHNRKTDDKQIHSSGS